MINSLKTNIVPKLKLIKVLLVIFGFNLINFELNAHLRGYYKIKSEANEKAKEIGCIGTFKLNQMWMPCKNEKELHKYLRKNK